MTHIARDDKGLDSRGRSLTLCSIRIKSISTDPVLADCEKCAVKYSELTINITEEIKPVEIVIIETEPEAAPETETEPTVCKSKRTPKYLRTHKSARAIETCSLCRLINSKVERNPALDMLTELPNRQTQHWQINKELMSA